MAAKDYVFQTGCFGTVYLAKKTKKQRLPRKLKKEMKKLKRIEAMQLHYGTRKGFGMNKWTWKLYCLYCRWFKNIQQQPLHIARQGTSSKNNPHPYGFENNWKW